MRFPLSLMIALAVPASAQPTSAAILLHPDRVFDRVDSKPHEGWSVLVEGDRIAAVGSKVAAPAGAKVIALPGTTLMPGMSEGHGHMFLHPYNRRAGTISCCASR